jgi:hypothetical protein
VSAGAARVTKRCTVCARFRAYDPDDAYCLVCGHESLETSCTCGRDFDYALAEHGDELHCPRCGKKLRGRAGEYE